ncbi:hypothetical protein J6590_036767 [Homalodisca vitripennis]|nr:hypothetical protein J6590_036767 [Homalodisca vitripennis]
MVVEAHNMVRVTALRRARKKLREISTKEYLQKNSAKKKSEEKNDKFTVEEIKDFIINIPRCSEFSTEEVGEWLLRDSTDSGFYILNVDELVQIVVTAGSDDPVTGRRELHYQTREGGDCNLNGWSDNQSVTICNCSLSNECETWWHRIVMYKNIKNFTVI